MLHSFETEARDDAAYKAMGLVRRMHEARVLALVSPTLHSEMGAIVASFEAAREPKKAELREMRDDGKWPF